MQKNESYSISLPFNKKRINFVQNDTNIEPAMPKIISKSITEKVDKSGRAYRGITLQLGKERVTVDLDILREDIQTSRPEMVSAIFEEHDNKAYFIGNALIGISNGKFFANAVA